MIEGRDFEKLINQYDHEGAFFYCDPPYSRGCGYEVTSTKDFDHDERLREVLGAVKGRFLLSYDDSPKIRETQLYTNILTNLLFISQVKLVLTTKSESLLKLQKK